MQVFLVSLALLWLLGSRLEGGRYPILPGEVNVTFVTRSLLSQRTMPVLGGRGGRDMVSNGVLSLWNPRAVSCHQRLLAVQLLWVEQVVLEEACWCGCVLLPVIATVRTWLLYLCISIPVIGMSFSLCLRLGEHAYPSPVLRAEDNAL